MAEHASQIRLGRLLNLPELNMALFAFLLNFIWEILQIPFFHGMEQARHWDAVLLCTQSTLGDVGIALTAFWTIAWLGGGRTWPLRPAAVQVAGFGQHRDLDHDRLQAAGHPSVEPLEL